MVDAQTRERLSTFAYLFVRSYEPPNRIHSHNGWDHVANDDEGGVWLWKKRDQDVWALIIRGTQIMREVVQDFELASASSQLSSGEGWSRACHEKWDVVRTLLHDCRVPTNALVIISGHSLGASFAEYLLHRLRNRPYVKGVTFDSSGLPDSMIANEGIARPLPNLTTCNNSPNFVNTLNKPLAGGRHFYSAGRGAAIPLTGLPAAGLRLLCDKATGIVIRVCEWNLLQHSIRKIQRLIDDNEIQHSNPTTWPRYAGTALEHAPEAGALVGTGAGAWFIGMTGWGAWAGPVLAGPGGVIAGGTVIIATGPLAATLAVTGVVYGVRKTGIPSRITSFFT